MTATIKPTTMAGHEMDKRTYLPFIVKDACPKCGVKSEVDLSDEYLSYPTLGEPTPVYCVCEKCSHEWSVMVVVGYTLTLAPMAKPRKTKTNKETTP